MDCWTECRIRAFGPELHRLDVQTKPFFLKHHPWLCGLLAYALHSRIQEIAMPLLNTSGWVVAGAHLYNAVMREGLLNIKWPTIDYFIAIFSQERVFCGPTPIEPAGFFARYAFSQGASIQVFARHRRNEKHIRVKQSKPTLNGDEILLGILRKRYCSTNFNSNMLLEQIEKNLHKIASSTLKGSKGGGNIKSSNELEPVQLLAVLQDTVAEDEAKLVFNYLGLQGVVWRMLRWIEGQIHDDFKRWWRQHSLTKEKWDINASLQSVTWLIFSYLEQTDLDLRQLGREWLSLAAKAVEKATKENQEAEANKAQSSDDTDTTSDQAPEPGPATLWGILESSHSTQKG